jgi:hypothetical protein
MSETVISASPLDVDAFNQQVEMNKEQQAFTSSGTETLSSRYE